MERSGWTGGQYSLLRVALGACLALGSVGGLLGAGAAMALPYLLAIVAGVLLASGISTRPAALTLLGVGVLASLSGDALSLAAGFAWAVLLIAAALTPGEPYGSWPARERPDAGAGWTMPEITTPLSWIGLGLAYVVHGASLGAVGVLPGVFFLAFAHRPQSRPWLWGLSAAAQILGIGAPDWPSIPFALLQWWAFDPSWIPRAGRGERAIVFYDGDCGLCHRTVRFLLSEDADGSALHYAPLVSAAFIDRVPESERADLPDSIVLCLPDGELRVQSEAMLEIGRRLGGTWRVLAELALFIPLPIRDTVYEAVARVRKQIFETPEDACPLVPPDLRQRFLG